MRLLKSHLYQNPLSEDQVRTFKSQGFLLLSGLLSTEVIEELQTEAQRLETHTELISAKNIRTETWRNGKTLMLSKYDPVRDVSPLVANLVNDPSIMDVLRRIWDDEPIPFKDKLIFKQPGHPGFGPHQDNTWWRPFPLSLITAMVSIDPATEINGAIQVSDCADRTHNPVPKGELRDLKQTEAPPGHSWQMAATDPGDVLFFTCMTPHRSGPNLGTHSRRVLHLTYGPRRDGDHYAKHYEHLRNYSISPNLESLGNHYLPPQLREEADFFPPVPGVQPRPKLTRRLV